MYTFKRIDCKLYKGGALLMNVGNSSQQAESLYPGQAIALFGEPDYFTEDYENLFSMVVAAESEAGGEPIYLEIYHGPSGPAIGGLETPEAKAAAHELAELLVSAKPADYDWEGVYEDIPVNIKMGVKNGVPYHESEYPDDFDPEDFI